LRPHDASKPCPVETAGLFRWQISVIAMKDDWRAAPIQHAKQK